MAEQTSRRGQPDTPASAEPSSRLPDSPTPRLLGIGLVGAGTIGEVHADAIASLREVRLVAVADPREEPGRALAAAHGADWHADLAALLARPDVDVVILATPSGFHAEQAAQAAAAGKHVITEKPMATTLAGADRMIAAAKAAGVQLAVIFQNRFGLGAQRLKREVEAGTLGRIVLANAFVHWHRTDAYYAASGGWRGTWALDGGGALINQSIHTIDLLQWIAGPVVSVAAETATLTHSIEAEDDASAAIRFAHGALGTIQGTTAAGTDWPVRVEIVGTAGRAILAGDTLTMEPGSLDEPTREAEPFGTGHARQLRAIFAALAAGETPPVPGDEARQAVEIIRAIYRSARTGQRVTLPLADDEIPVESS